MKRRGIHTVQLALALVLGVPAVGNAQGDTGSPDLPRLDPKRLRYAETCKECHVSEYAVWEKSPHQTPYRTLHKQELARMIKDRLGVRLVNRNSICLNCHYTPEAISSGFRAKAGPSCESCHGAGADWINIHNNYGEGYNFRTEPAEHRAERIRRSREAGMRRPSDIYPVMASCYECHLVPNEQLVNVGGHPTSSGNFELVKWLTRDDIRHNFLESFLTGDGTEIAARDPVRERVLHVVGRCIDLEYSLRGAALATEPGLYLSALTNRTAGTVCEVQKINALTPIERLDDILGVLNQVNIRANNRDALLAAADQIGEQTRALILEVDGGALAALDPLIRGEPVDLAGPCGEPVVADESAVPESLAPPAFDVVGEAKAHIRPRPTRATLGPGNCNCHGPQNAWWFSDPHFGAHDPFRSPSFRLSQIARNYGIERSGLLRGNKLCMDCHGTVVTGRERGIVNVGVSCESCHGPAADYRDPHSKGDIAAGIPPGYRLGLPLGLAELEDAVTQARTCLSCHYITDERLLSAGHRSGEDYDLAAAVRKTKHWKSDAVSASALAAAADQVRAERGPVPVVTVATNLTPPPGTRANDPAEPDRGSPPQSVRATAADARAKARDLEIPEFPEIDPSASVDEILLVVQERLELLYERVYR